MGQADVHAAVARFTFQVKTLYHCGMTSTISSKGQITVPKAVRDRLGLRTGARVEFELVERGVILRKGRPRGARPVDLVRGILARRVSTDRVIDEMRGSGLATVKRRK